MKNNYSIAERNRIVEEHLWCIDRVIRKNRSLMRAARLDYDDVYPSSYKLGYWAFLWFDHILDSNRLRRNSIFRAALH